MLVCVSQLAVAIASDEVRRGLLVSRDKGQELVKCGGEVFSLVYVCVCVQTRWRRITGASQEQRQDDEMWRKARWFIPSSKDQDDQGQERERERGSDGGEWSLSSMAARPGRMTQSVEGICTCTCTCTCTV